LLPCSSWFTPLPIHTLPLQLPCIPNMLPFAAWLVVVPTLLVGSLARILYTFAPVTFPARRLVLGSCPSGYAHALRLHTYTVAVYCLALCLFARQFLGLHCHTLLHPLVYIAHPTAFGLDSYGLQHLGCLCPFTLGLFTLDCSFGWLLTLLPWVGYLYPLFGSATAVWVYCPVALPSLLRCTQLLHCPVTFSLLPASFTAACLAIYCHYRCRCCSGCGCWLVTLHGCDARVARHALRCCIHCSYAVGLPCGIPAFTAGCRCPLVIPFGFRTVPLYAFCTAVIAFIYTYTLYSVTMPLTCGGLVGLPFIRTPVRFLAPTLYPASSHTLCLVPWLTGWLVAALLLPWICCRFTHTLYPCPHHSLVIAFVYYGCSSTPVYLDLGSYLPHCCYWFRFARLHITHGWLV